MLLDQLGSAVKPALTPTHLTNGVSQISIIRTLEYFAPSVTPAGRDVLYALRNSLAHDYSLFNQQDSALTNLPRRAGRGSRHELVARPRR